MKKKVLGMILVTMGAQAVVPSVVLAVPAQKEAVQMGREEKVQKLKAAREALALLQEQLQQAEKADDGRWVVKIRDGALISAGILGGATVLGIASMSGSSGNNVNAYRYGIPTLGAALGTVASLVVAGTSQGVLLFSDSEVKKVEARIKAVNEAIIKIEDAID